MNLASYNIWGLLYYFVLALLAIIFTYLGVRALQAIISIDKTLREMLNFELNKQKKLEEREMRRI